MRLTKQIGEQNIFHVCDKNCQSCSGTMCGFVQAMLDKLAAYEDAEEKGLLVRLPCKVGDTVFFVEGHSVYEFQVDSISLHDDGLRLDGTFNHFGLVSFSGEIGRNIFLTRTEAEAALMKGESVDV